MRSSGGGRQRLDEQELVPALERLVDPATRGDPQSPLRWTCKSTGQLAEDMTQAGHPISAGTVATLRKRQGYSLQCNRKTKEGAQHPDHDAQFEQINPTVKRFAQQGQPVISVDAKKKELVGAFKNGGREWQPKGELLIAADGGGGNGSGCPLWKTVLQQLANELWLRIISLIANTTTRTGLRIRAELGCNSYPIDIKVGDEDLAGLALAKDDFHGEWNYVLLPQ